jgi:hypothetical protein
MQIHRSLRRPKCERLPPPRSRRAPRRDLKPSECTQRLGNVLRHMLANVFERRFDMTRDRIVYGARDNDASRRRKRLQASSNIDPIAIDSAIHLLENLAEMNADTELHRHILVIVIPVGGQLRLDSHGSSHCASCRIENGQHGVSRRVDDSPTRGFDGGAKDLASCIERLQGGHGVYGHHARVSNRVSSQDRQESMPYAVILHGDAQGRGCTGHLCGPTLWQWRSFEIKTQGACGVHKPSQRPRGNSPRKEGADGKQRQLEQLHERPLRACHTGAPRFEGRDEAVR